jgi:intein/homing endonuclease
MDCILIRTDVFKKLSEPWFETVDEDQYLDAVPNAEQWTEDLFFCFPPGEAVYGDMKPIEQYNEGDKVLSHKGTLRRVTNTISREYSGDLIEISPHYGSGFRLTPNHPVLVGKEKKCEWVSAEEVKESDYLVVPMQTRVREDRVQFLPTWDLIRNKHVDFKGGEFKYTRTSKNLPYFPLKVNITPELCRLVGYWVAEGSVSGSSVSDKCTVNFTFHEKEKEYIDDVVGLVKNIFGLESSIDYITEKNTTQIHICSTPLADFLVKYFGRLAGSKKVPEEIIFSRLSCTKEFLKGFWRGDGNKGFDGNYALVTTSKELHNALRCMLIRVGLYPTTHFSKPNLSYHINIARKFYDEWTDLLEVPKIDRSRINDVSSIKRFKNPSSVGGGYFLVKVKSTSKSHYEGPVYNLSVSTDETYNVNGFAVHNCNKLLDETDYKIFADATVICEHWDAVTRQKWTLPPDSYPVQEIENPKRMVDLGCGETTWHFEGEGRPLRVDIREEVDPDFRADVRQLPFENESFTVAFSSHCLEHIGISLILSGQQKGLKMGLWINQFLMSSTVPRLMSTISTDLGLLQLH